mgnify:CR=1 FL=1
MKPTEYFNELTDNWEWFMEFPIEDPDHPTSGLIGLMTVKGKTEEECLASYKSAVRGSWERRTTSARNPAKPDC